MSHIAAVLMHETLGSFVDIVLIVRQTAKIRSKSRQQIGLYRGHSLLGVAAVAAVVAFAAAESVATVVAVEAARIVATAVAARIAATAVAARIVATAVAPQKNQKLHLAHHYTLQSHNRPTPQDHQDERE